MLRLERHVHNARFWIILQKSGKVPLDIMAFTSQDTSGDILWHARDLAQFCVRQKEGEGGALTRLAC